MACTHPILLSFKGIHKMKYREGVTVPCGKCLSCRINRSREWSMRVLHETESWKDSIFVTLTYDDKFLPWNDNALMPTLKKSHLQKFFKRLRKVLKKRKIKYYACGEYGDKTYRPHYHCIIFGLSFDEHKVYHNGDVDGPVSAAWKYGFINIGNVSYDSVRYVAGYIDKKYYGNLAEKEYYSLGREQPFQICSTRLGASYALANSQRIKDDLMLTVNGNPVSIPRYYVKLLGIESRNLREFALDKSIGVQMHYLNKGVPTYLISDSILDAREQNEMALKSKRALFRKKL